MLIQGLGQALAQPTIVSVVPSNGATSISPNAAIVFTFSVAMDPAATTVFVADVTANNNSPTVVSAWSAGNTKLTCTPYPYFANNHQIQWSVSGQDTLGNFLGGSTVGHFTTVAGVNGGSGTNALTTFELSKFAEYQQVASTAPAFIGYEFYAQSILASNRSASSVTVTIPTTGGVSNLVEDSLEPEKFSKAAYNPNLASFNATFPTGTYTFNVTGNPAQQVMITLPNFAQPNPPQISNYAAAQTIDPLQPFTLEWNSFTNATTADGILVQISDSTHPGIILFQTIFYGQPGGLNGTTTSVTIPAGTLPANSTNSGVLFFAHVANTTAGDTVTYAIVASATVFVLRTTAASSGGGAPVLTIVPSGANVLLEWPTNAVGYNLHYSTNLTATGWSAALPSPVVVNTNNVVTNSISTPQRYFRLSNP